MLRAVLEQFEREEHIKRGYDIVYGPTILKKDLWVCSGHYDNYKENMYFTEIDGVEFGIKPMNCLSHIMIYKNELHSYRDLPLRYFELGTVHRHEKSGVLHGLMRVRAFTQDDAHIFCRQDQLLEEITNILDFVKSVMDIFGFEFIHTVSTRPEEKFIGTVANGTSDRVRGSVLYFNNHSADVSGSVFENNTANGYGDNLTAGAVYIENQSDQKQTLTIENSSFENNAAVGDAGMLFQQLLAADEVHRRVIVGKIIRHGLDRFFDRLQISAVFCNDIADTCMLLAGGEDRLLCAAHTLKRCFGRNRILPCIQHTVDPADRIGVPLTYARPPEGVIRAVGQDRLPVQAVEGEHARIPAGRDDRKSAVCTAGLIDRRKMRRDFCVCVKTVNNVEILRKLHGLLRQVVGAAAAENHDVKAVAHPGSLFQRINGDVCAHREALRIAPCKDAGKDNIFGVFKRIFHAAPQIAVSDDPDSDFFQNISSCVCDSTVFYSHSTVPGGLEVMS